MTEMDFPDHTPRSPATLEEDFVFIQNGAVGTPDRDVHQVLVDDTDAYIAEKASDVELMICWWESDEDA